MGLASERIEPGSSYRSQVLRLLGITFHSFTVMSNLMRRRSYFLRMSA